ncbi:lipoyl(octanoyl) transferase LipB [Portibacter marinus]|uniref:lipoyl(octanoyl) transferase LipB n=1 Tax=Portibacter marinus TaxID=2898660 RepID=UPI001F3BFD60|nr:lipoyl(octanoyl) transferase LipB [Portibacter marinus]
MNDTLVQFQDWGRISYRDAWDKQTILHNRLKDRKIKNRREGLEETQEHFLIYCEHQPVYTLGKSGSMNHLLLSEEDLKQREIDFFKINRGGDITYHGPGQIVVYPIFDLDEFFTDVHQYVRYLEEAVIRTLAHFEIQAERLKDYTGVWLPRDQNGPQRKICAIGVHLSRWVTMHGLAFNVNTDLEYFRYIIPCGIAEKDKDVTSLERELGRKVDYKGVKEILKSEFQRLFEFKFSGID